MRPRQCATPHHRFQCQKSLSLYAWKNRSVWSRSKSHVAWVLLLSNLWSIWNRPDLDRKRIGFGRKWIFWQPNILTDFHFAVFPWRFHQNSLKTHSSTKARMIAPEHCRKCGWFRAEMILCYFSILFFLFFGGHLLGFFFNQYMKHCWLFMLANFENFWLSASCRKL